MKYSSILISLLALTLASCGGSGSSGGGNSGGNDDDKPAKETSAKSSFADRDSIQVTAYETDFGTGHETSFTADGDNFVLGGEEVRSQVNGQDYSCLNANLEQCIRNSSRLHSYNGDIYLVMGEDVYIDENGAQSAIAWFDLSPENMPASGGEIGSEIITINDVQYWIRKIENDQIVAYLTPKQFYQGDEDFMTAIAVDAGQIEIEDETFTAYLGAMTLSSEINGYEVSGNAKFEDMEGAFKGYIAKDINWSHFHEAVSEGVFAGDNGSDAAFSGGWTTKDH